MKGKTTILGIGLLAVVAMVFAGANIFAGGQGDSATYVGSENCMMCHIKTYKAWEKKGHAHSFEGIDPAVVADRIAGAVIQLESQGWTRVVRVENGFEQVYVYSMDGGNGTIAGLTALVNDGGDEAVVANIAGAIDPVLLGSMMTRLGDIDFDKFMPDDG